MNGEDEEKFQPSNEYWICEKLIDGEDEKVRDHCHVTEKTERAARWNCNVSFKLTNSVPLIFQN